MSNIRQAFQNGKAFIPFITCGDPDLESTKRNVRAAVVAGADLVELGIPFSDPTAEGPVIQAANLRALSGGVTTDAVFQMVAELREELTTPFVFMTYANVVFSYGIEHSRRARRKSALTASSSPMCRLRRRRSLHPHSGRPVSTSSR